jgi:hypothetical protein
MRKLLFIILLLSGKFAFAQTYNNEWIDYSKTYYKFKIGNTGLYRITGNALPAALVATSADQLQLWRNGKQVTLYTSVASGALGSGYLEFWGEKNDGKPDQPLYYDPSFQYSDRISLETDTAAYFLTVNTNTANNFRYLNQTNPVAGNVLPPSQYFMYTARQDYKQMINKGYAQYLGVYVYSSAYDEGEWWSSNEFRSQVLPDPTATPPTTGSPAQPLNYTFTGLKPYTAGPTSSLRLSVAGTAPNNRNIQATLNSNSVFNNNLNGIAAAIMSGSVVTTSITDNSQVVVSSDFANKVAADRAVVGFIELTYPRTWDFNNQNSFEFSLPSTSSVYLEITNFNAGTPAPVLYDRTNKYRYVADISVAGKFRFVLPADGARDFVLVSQQTSGFTNLTQSDFQQKSFTNFSSGVNQGDYLIITNSQLRTSGDPVEQYRQYRSSGNGGSYKAIIYDIDELTDQFAFGIRKHPLSVKNFLRFARANFSSAPKLAFLIGRGVTYDEYYWHQGQPNAEKLNMVPTFGYPGSDVLLASNDNNPVPATPIGRLAAIAPQEVNDYLVKMRDYETVQRTGSQTLAEKKWMKNVVHVAGGANASEDYSLSAELGSYKAIIEDSLYGGKVYDFNKTTTGAATVISDALLSSLLTNGIGLLTYFGHGSSNALNYNLPALNTWNNQGKYPLFIMLGCNVGNIFSYDEGRLTTFQTLSERYILTPQTGGIGMIASTHFGTEGELHAYATEFYKNISRVLYNQPVADAIRQTTQTLNTTNFLMRLHLEEHLLHGDPAFKPNSFPKPDYVIEEPQIFINPTFISVADTSFNVKIYVHNIGKASGGATSTVALEVKRQYPDGSTAVVYTKNIQPAVRNVDSVSFTLPIVPTRDKGQNKLIVTIDYNNKYDELSESNNSNEKQFFIFEDELRPVYPYNFAIINKNNAKLVASTADPLLSSRSYVMEMDTTELFNSPSKITKTITSPGGAIEFDPGITYQDSTVYYWRVAIVPSSGLPHWNNSSFVYLNGTGVGFNQSQFYQFTKSTFNRIYIDSSDRKWKFAPAATNLYIRNRIYRAGAGLGDSEFAISINGATPAQIYSACPGPAPKIIFNVFDPVTMKPYYNQSVPSTTASGVGTGTFMNSVGACAPGREYNFEFSYGDSAGRRQMRDFLDAMPNGVVITARNISGNDASPYVSIWKTDAAVYGNGNTLYDRFKAAGFTDLDSFTYSRAWAFIYKKNNTSFAPQWQFTQDEFDAVLMNVNVASPDTLGYVTSPKFGPAASWQQIKWRGASLENPSTDTYTVTVIGVRANGQEDVLYTLNNTQQDFNISSVSAVTYPYIRLQLYSEDKQNLTPYQLRWWRLYYTPVPEGALAGNIKLISKDTLEVGEPLNFGIAFKNVSDVAFANTIKVNAYVRDQNNQQTLLNITRLKAIGAGDTAMVTYQVNTQNLTGTNTLFIDVNPDNDQPEYTHMNNFLYKNFFVKGDVYKPTLDVTFDGVRILSGDIVSAKPRITIKLKDESKFLPLNDTSLVTILLRYPDNTVKRFKFGTDTLQFTPATPGGDNVATVDFMPKLPIDGEYELTITGKDRTGNTAGNLEYRVLFNVYNTPMISNMFNYPNPFTTSTAFVFTLTGSVIPQNLKIQILTVTGKIVREITKDELGPLNIGRNITDFKWDGTDQYGQKLANGVYLYRVVTNLNGSSLEKFPTLDQNGSKTNTDQYFNKGYGKMYLMR